MKTLKIKSCLGCAITRFYKSKINCPMLNSNQFNLMSEETHPDCPLDDICDCEPFQSCEKCRKKTTWFELTEMQPKYGVKYWLLFEDDSIKKGWFWEPTKKWFWDFKYKNEIKETVVMFAEIKPPEIK